MPPRTVVLALHLRLVVQVYQLRVSSNLLIEALVSGGDGGEGPEGDLVESVPTN